MCRIVQVRVDCEEASVGLMVWFAGALGERATRRNEGRVARVEIEDARKDGRALDVGC